ncbi:hypothetical protein [Paenibacillus monticola]|uniref:DUF2680 domain-containing protein n=1 Tax=Paenibacillus monticola TaxID=2666075 RepID=A0A7X2H2L7_9BACL|nr:hypothetical protein [Paenibacillus monticola]MRN52426.1 hypothetical protein [Paenibacillus monticola]
MSNRIKRITVIAVAVLFSITPAMAFANPVGTERAPSTAPDSIHSENAHRAHPGKEGGFRAGGHFIIIETARLLEMDRTELVNKLKAGKTLSGLALEKKGWSEEQYIQKLSEAASLKLDKAITEGRLTADEATKLKAALPAILKLRINKVEHFHEGKPADQQAKNPK